MIWKPLSNCQHLKVDTEPLGANMQYSLIIVNLLLCGTSQGQKIPFINIFDEFLHQLDVFHLLDSPRPAPTFRPVARPPTRPGQARPGPPTRPPGPPTRPQQPSAPRRPKKLQKGRQTQIRSKLPPILNNGAGATSDAWVIFL